MPKREPEAPATPEEERDRREAEELESFERRAEWSRLHYGTPIEDADERTRKAVEQAEKLPADADERSSERRDDTD
jgi:hypothetical protein